ncbi:MAG: ImmA/IrrE family metallo-endopeptidase, partial [Bacteroidota bacterium]
MKRGVLAFKASLAADQIIKDLGILSLPVNPIPIARDSQIEVLAKPAAAIGVSGMLIRSGNLFAIAYATHIDNIGFQNFSIAHELGHYFLPGHIDAVFTNGDIHESQAGFASGSQYEMEADHFAASLLMPRSLFIDAMYHAGDGLHAIETLSERCQTSLTATGIRYVQCSRDAVAIVLSTGSTIDYCFMSESMREASGLRWIHKGEGLTKYTATYVFNKDRTRVLRSDRVEDQSDLQYWFASER